MQRYEFFLHPEQYFFTKLLPLRPTQGHFIGTQAQVFEEEQLARHRFLNHIESNTIRATIKRQYIILI